MPYSESLSFVNGVFPMLFGAQFLADLVHYRTYSSSLPCGRKETRKETIDRCMQMHLDKFPKEADDIVRAFSFVHKGMAVPSMRSLQFGNQSILRENIRGYNCSYAPIKSFQDFGDCLYILCCGAGFGFSSQKMFVHQLPTIVYGDNEPIFVIPDSKEGWADSVVNLLKNPRIRFDYSQIRPFGAPLSSGGWASGPDPLRKCHELIRGILYKHMGSRLTSLDVADIICHIADAIVVAGTRRSALINLFDADDAESLSAKTGAWWETNPQRARMNMSAVIHRDDQFAIAKAEGVLSACFASGAGEPGLFWTNDFEYGGNPCQPEFATVLTPDGIKTFADIDVGSTIWSGKRWTKVVAKWKTGVKPVFEYRTSAGRFVGTENHRIVQFGEKVEVKDAHSIDIAIGETLTKQEIDPQDIMDGLVIGDGSVHKASNDSVYLTIGKDDHSHFESEVASLIIGHQGGLSQKAYEIHTTVVSEEIKKTFERRVPDRFFFGDSKKKIGFLRGLYSANGSVCGNRITLKVSSFAIISQVQEMLSSLGIRSYYTVNAPHDVKFSNGTYTCKESYDLNISTDCMLFVDMIGFIQGYKMDKVSSPCVKASFDIRSIAPIGDHEVYDITVDDEDHTYWTGGCLVSNCNEISLRALCNLTELNIAACHTPRDLIDAVWAATYIGTLQASYTNFNYVQPRWKQYAEEESLLGVSFTGQAMNWPLLSAENLAHASSMALATNSVVAGRIGINPAHRIGTTKPSGSTSAWLGTKYGVPSGIHAAHDRRYVRRVRVDINNPMGLYFLENFPVSEAESGEILELDKFNPNNIVVSIPVEMNGAIVRQDESAIDLMERARHIHSHWIKPTHRQGPNTHNVSLTVSYKPEEQSSIVDWMIKNRYDYAGMALLPFDGGTYCQAPFESVSDEVFEQYQSKFDSMNMDLTSINWSGHEDQRMGESACSAGGCEVT
jgi:hypothetical protein